MAGTMRPLCPCYFRAFPTPYRLFMQDHWTSYLTAEVSPKCKSKSCHDFVRLRHVSRMEPLLLYPVDWGWVQGPTQTQRGRGSHKGLTLWKCGSPGWGSSLECRHPSQCSIILFVLMGEAMGRNQAMWRERHKQHLWWQKGRHNKSFWRTWERFSLAEAQREEEGCGWDWRGSWGQAEPGAWLLLSFSAFQLYII